MTALSYGTHLLKTPAPFCPNATEYNCSVLSESFRTLDGSCNNQLGNRSWWGKSETPLKRLLAPEYEDYAGEPRSRSTLPYKKLPNARTVALNVFRPQPSVSEWSHLMTYFALFLDHDLSLTAQSTYADGFRKLCSCNTHDSDCFNIQIPYGDYVNQDQTCMSFVRSMPSVNHFNCNLGPREQLNVQTAWMDLSDLYGFNDALADRIRLKSDGLLKSYEDNAGEFLPHAETYGCSNSLYSTEYSRRAKCFIEGDPRAEDNAILTSIHTVWLREHNRVAKELKQVNPCWTDEKLYQHARRICIAQFQNIVYGEYLPGLLGRKLSELYNLVPLATGYFSSYKSDLYPQIINEFSTAAFRYGHTQIAASVHSASKRYALSDAQPTSFYLFNNDYYKSAMADILRGTLMDWSYAPNAQANQYLSDHLWENVFKLDSKRFVTNFFKKAVLIKVSL